MTSKCCAFVLCLPGSEGYLLLRECVNSFIHFEGIEEIIIVELAVTVRDLKTSVETTKPVHWMHLPHVAMDDALNMLVRFALDRGFTHALHLRSHEILKHSITGEMLTGLPEGWQEAHVFQIATSTKYRSVSDILINLDAFPSFLGPIFPAPFPADHLDGEEDIDARPWLHACLVANTFNIPRSRAQELIRQLDEKLLDLQLTPVERGYLLYQQGLAFLQAQEYEKAFETFQQGLEDGMCWAGFDGKYVFMLGVCRAASKLQRPLHDMLSFFLEISQLGIALGRLEGMLAYYTAILLQGSKNMSATIAFALRLAVNMPPFDNKSQAVWNGPSDTFYLAHEMLGVGTNSYAHMAAAAENPNLRLADRMKHNCKVLARPGDDLALFRSFPSVTTLFLPATIVHRQYLSNTTLAAEELCKLRAPYGRLHPYPKFDLLFQNALGTNISCGIADDGEQALLQLFPQPGSPPLPLNLISSPEDDVYSYTCVLAVLSRVVVTVEQTARSQDIIHLEPGDMACIRSGHAVQTYQKDMSVPVGFLVAHVKLTSVC